MVAGLDPLGTSGYYAASRDCYTRNYYQSTTTTLTTNTTANVRESEDHCVAPRKITKYPENFYEGYISRRKEKEMRALLDEKGKKVLNFNTMSVGEMKKLENGVKGFVKNPKKNMGVEKEIFRFDKHTEGFKELGIRLSKLEPGLNMSYVKGLDGSITWKNEKDLISALRKGLYVID